MDKVGLQNSLDLYSSQLIQVKEALRESVVGNDRDSLLTLQTDLEQLIGLTQESLDTISNNEAKTSEAKAKPQVEITNGTSSETIDDEYALFMKEMEQTGAYDKDEKDSPHKQQKHDDNSSSSNGSDIEDELSTLLGMKCAVYHTHKWGGQPTLYNAMVCSVIPRQENDKFKDLQVRVLFTHPTHAEMVPCPFYLDGECKFSDELCRYSHGEIVPLSSLKEALEPNFNSIKTGSRVLIKLKPPDDEELSLTKKSAEKYYLWHRGTVKCVSLENKRVLAKLEQGLRTGQKRKSDSDELDVSFEMLFPLNDETIASSDSEDSLSDTDYADLKTQSLESEAKAKELLVEKSLQSSGPAMGEWERHTRGIASKIMLSMGYVAGTGLGASSDGRLEPVPARVLPVGKSLDHCMDITDKKGEQDPLKVELKLKRMQKKEEERNKKAYEREKEKERTNVFNFLNKTLGNKLEDAQPSAALDSKIQIKQSTSKDLNIEQFKITEEVRKVERQVFKLKNSLQRHSESTNVHRSVNLQLSEKRKELDRLKSKEAEIINEQKCRKDKEKLTLF